ncbi:hypothetical protein BD289DRAFT_284882 [Coniella lustricola]|uniref:Uncharacterized protein n=1 Tax=Coniella lustricola TaxID=2025994 RepID=A0A2T3AK77_9PEZI|nr:hypothetical protein BD289DRAFT_284882 [Coniella lustricola]
MDPQPSATNTKHKHNTNSKHTLPPENDMCSSKSQVQNFHHKELIILSFYRKHAKSQRSQAQPTQVMPSQPNLYSFNFTTFSVQIICLTNHKEESLPCGVCNKQRSKRHCPEKKGKKRGGGRGIEGVVDPSCKSHGCNTYYKYYGPGCVRQDGDQAHTRFNQNPDGDQENGCTGCECHSQSETMDGDSTQASETCHNQDSMLLK